MFNFPLNIFNIYYVNIYASFYCNHSSSKTYNLYLNVLSYQVMDQALV